MDMDMNFSISSPARPQFVSYSLPSHGLAIPSWIDVDDSRNIAEYLQSRSEADEILWRSSNNMTPLFLDYKPNSRLQRVGVEEENELYDESSDEFRMYKFKVVICTKESSHDWTECPFAHRGERARRRDPNLYCGETCPEYKKGYCRKGLTCEFAHGLFETWLHPQRYRTQRCKDGIHCNRRVCFFAHNDGELRSTSVSSPSNLKHMQQSASSKGGSNGYSSPRRYACTNVLIPQTYHGLGLQQESFPGVAVPAHVVLSPLFMNSSPSPSSNSVSSGSLPGSSLGSPCGLEDVVAALRNVDLSNDEFNYSATQSALQNHVNRDQYTLERSSESGLNCGLHRLDSGKKLRAEIYKKYRKDQLQQEYSVCAADQPDLAWVSELVEEV